MVKIRKMIRMTSEMSMASMSDIAFLLIIFFMVASVFILKDGLHLVLPDKTKKPVAVSAKNIITITMENKGVLLYNNGSINDKDLEDKLRNEIKNNIKSFVLLKIGNKVKYSRAVEIIDKIKFAGIKKLSIKMMKQ